MSYRIKIDPRSSKAGRFIRRVHSELQRVFARSGMSQQQLASKLEVNRATVNKRLLGQENLTLRSIADMAWALDADIVFELREHDRAATGNKEPRASASAVSVPSNAGLVVAASTAPNRQLEVIAGNV